VDKTIYGRKERPGLKPGATFLSRDLDHEQGVFRVISREDR
jgi:hypothetical protein